MKRIQILFIAVLFAGGVFAQPGAGKFFLGGDMSIFSMKNKVKVDNITQDNVTNTYITVMPGAGYFLGDKLAIGTYLGIDATIGKDPDPEVGEPEKLTQMLFVFSPFCRYYLSSGQGGLFAEASVTGGFGSIKLEFAGGSIDFSSMELAVGLQPGVYYYITEKLALEAKIGWIGYENEILTDEDDNQDITSGFGIELFPGNFAFGLTVTL